MTLLNTNGRSSVSLQIEWFQKRPAYTPHTDSTLMNFLVCKFAQIATPVEFYIMRSTIAFTAPFRAYLSANASKPSIPAQMLADLYGLTKAEANLCNALLQKSGLSAAALHLGISINTAKTQLQSVFQKTVTGRQPDLIRLLADGPWLLARLHVTGMINPENDNAGPH